MWLVRGVVLGPAVGLSFPALVEGESIQIMRHVCVYVCV